MGKFEGILFCTDLDGTLYASDKSVSERNLEAIEYFKAEGGAFTFITGRVPKTSTDICRTIKPNVPYGCINGGGIFDHVNNEYLWFMELDKAAVAMADQVARELPDFGIQLNSTKEIYSYRDNQAMVDFRRITGVDDVECPEGGPSEPLV